MLSFLLETAVGYGARPTAYPSNAEHRIMTNRQRNPPMPSNFDVEAML
jgi:hypothetical protein